MTDEALLWILLGVALTFLIMPAFVWRRRPYRRHGYCPVFYQDEQPTSSGPWVWIKPRPGTMPEIYLNDGRPEPGDYHRKRTAKRLAEDPEFAASFAAEVRRLRG